MSLISLSDENNLATLYRDSRGGAVERQKKAINNFLCVYQIKLY